MQQTDDLPPPVVKLDNPNRSFDGERPRSAHEQVSRSLAVDILSGVLPIGATLPTEDVLLERFQVSRTVLREAMKTLSAKGLLASKPRIGTWVQHESHWNFFDPDLLSWKLAIGYDAQFRDDLAEIRRAIEPRAAALAAERRTEEELVGLRYWIAKMREPGHSARSFAKADLGLHLAVASASGNAMMRSIGAIIEAALVASFTLNSAVDEEDVHAHTLDKHEAIVDAIANRDGEAAAAAMLYVINLGTSRINASQDAKKRKAATGRRRK